MNQRPGGSFLSPETLDAIIQIFVEDAPQQMRDIQAALANGDHQTLAAISHKLRGATEFLGTSAISSLATSVEHAAKDGDESKLEKTVPELVVEVRMLLDQLDAAESGSG
jgi:HPt (histidine-containing phosphotransfer) domain-containing protein